MDQKSVGTVPDAEAGGHYFGSSSVWRVARQPYKDLDFYAFVGRSSHNPCALCFMHNNGIQQFVSTADQAGKNCFRQTQVGIIPSIFDETNHRILRYDCDDSDPVSYACDKSALQRFFNTAYSTFVSGSHSLPRSLLHTAL